MNEQKATELLKKYEQGTLSPQEKAKLETWYLRAASGEGNHLTEVELEESYRYLKTQLPIKTGKERVLWPKIAAAVAVLLILGMGLYFYTDLSTVQINSLSSYANDIVPGTNSATLILANGKQIKLSNAVKGELAQESGVVISKTADGQLVYEIKNRSIAQSNAVNTLSTAKGQTYLIRLPDGSMIWLNSASTLKYPASFVSLKERKVELNGEAYFMVKHNARQPFRVETRDQIVEDIGTEFNINAYQEENVIKTTLIEGSAKVSLCPGKGNTRHSDQEQTQAAVATPVNAVVLKPNQQSMITNGIIKVVAVDTKNAVAWKNGTFNFDNESIGNIMHTLSRWYNIDVQYEGKPSNEAYFGEISRFKNISQVLKMLEKTNTVHFRIEGRRVYVSK